jgi:hypothetical protein
VAQFGKVEIADAEVNRLTDRELAQRLVSEGVSRLTAARLVEIARVVVDLGCGALAAHRRHPQ